MWYNSQKSRKTERIDLIYQVYSNGFTWNGKQPRHICEYSKCISEPMYYTAELFSLSRLQEMHLVMNKQNNYYDMRQSLHTNEVNWYARSWTIYITRFFAIWPNANQIKSLIVPLHKLYCFNSIFFCYRRTNSWFTIQTDRIAFTCGSCLTCGGFLESEHCTRVSTYVHNWLCQIPCS